MTYKLLGALPLIMALGTAPAFAGALGTTITEPQITAPPPPPPGRMLPNWVPYLIPVVLIPVLLNENESSTTTTTAVGVVGN